MSNKAQKTKVTDFFMCKGMWVVGSSIVFLSIAPSKYVAGERWEVQSCHKVPCPDVEQVIVTRLQATLKGTRGGDFSDFLLRFRTLQLE